MKKILLITMILIAGCSSQSVNTSPAEEAALPKAVPPPGTGTTVYGGDSATRVNKPATTQEVPIMQKEKRSCETPLGTILDGEKATGFLSATVPPDEVCISDTLTCKDGKWFGQAIYPNCKVQKEK